MAATTAANLNAPTDQCKPFTTDGAGTLGGVDWIAPLAGWFPFTLTDGEKVYLVPNGVRRWSQAIYLLRFFGVDVGNRPFAEPAIDEAQQLVMAAIEHLKGRGHLPPDFCPAPPPDNGVPDDNLPRGDIVSLSSHSQFYAAIWLRGNRHNLFASTLRQDVEYSLSCVGLGIPGRDFSGMSAERRGTIRATTLAQWAKAGLPALTPAELV